MERERSLDALGDEITTLAAHLSAATCRWLELVGEFDAREGWAAWGCKSTAHWIGWRCSMAPGAAREHVRVARRLRDLPLVRAAFARGELSFSKVRAVTRVEDVEREEELLELARCSTAAQLERMVRGYRTVMLADAKRAHEERYLSIEHDDDGSVVLRGRLPREDGALVLKALEVFRDQAGRAHHAAASAPDASGDRRDPAVAAAVDTWTPRGGGVPTASVDVSGPVVADVSVAPPARGTQNADALVVLADAALEVAERAGGRTGGDRFQVVVHVDADTLASDGDADADGRAELADGAPLAAATVRRLCCDASVVGLVERAGKPLSVGRKTRSIPPALRRALRDRDGGCRFPGCTQHRWVDAHHIEHWAHGGETKLTNLVQVCRHHHRLLHEGGYTVERLRGNGSGGAGGGDGLLFRRPDGRRLVAAPRLPAGDVRRLRDEHSRRGLRITAETSVPDWYGDRLDLARGVDAVLACAGQT